MSVKNSFFPAKLHKVLCVFLCGIEIKPLYLQPLKELIIKTDVKPIKKNWIMKKMKIKPLICIPLEAEVKFGGDVKKVIPGKQL